MSATGIFRDSRCLNHLTDDGHPEHPRRLAAVYDMLDQGNRHRRCPSIPFSPAELDDLLLVHAPEYIERVAATESWDFGLIGPETPASAGSYLAARLAVGAVLEATRQVVSGRLQNAFALVRPPGHHAERSRAMGYCLFNNAAIAAAFARRRLEVPRVLLFDWDVHHGNGTQHIFERDPTVLFFSIHQYPHFPKTGYFTETGIGPGEGYTVNVPLPRGYGDGEYTALMEGILMPVARVFCPDLLIVSAGFDLHRGDPLGGMNLTETGFASMTRCLMNIAEQCCGGKMVLVLEGGYEPEILAASVLAVVDELSGQTCTDPAIVSAAGSSKKIRHIMNRCVQVQQRFWKTLAA
jgi:acetoin utilization deacetylase AcuC-like enzyme